MNATRPPCALTIAGSDSGGGAGIQADLKTFVAHGVHGLSAIAALTAQNTRGVRAVHVPPVAFLQAQLDACFEDFDIRAVKIGMLATREVIECVADALARAQSLPRLSMQSAPRRVRGGELEPDTEPEPPDRPGAGAARTQRLAIVLDPVMVATSGARLLADDALDALRTRLLPLADVLTPNLPEAEWLLGHPVHGADGMAAAARALRALGPRAVLLKGGHAPDNDSKVLDLLDDAGEVHRFLHPRLALDAHGTGCTLASALAARLARGEPLPQAVAGATDYVHAALVAGSTPGQAPLRVLDHMLGKPPAG